MSDCMSGWCGIGGEKCPSCKKDDLIIKLQAQVDRVNKLADHCASIAPDTILDRRTCAELIKEAIKGEQKQQSTPIIDYCLFTSKPLEQKL